VLFDADLIHLDVAGMAIETRISEYLTGLGDRKLKNAFFTREAVTHLGLEDFNLPAGEVRVLKALLKGSGGCNLLFYGAPGTGKTSLAKCLAKRFGLDLYNVRVDEQGDDHDFRFRAIHATANAVKRRSDLILIDEADEILNAAAMPNIRNLTNKSWINNFLDNHGRKIIWITNRSREVETSTMRRFSFSLKFDRLTAKSRTNVFQYELRKQGLKGSIENNVVCELAKQYDVDASGIVNAVNVMKLERRGTPETLRQMAETVLRNHQEATVGKKYSIRPRDFRSYSLEGLHTSQDLDKIVGVLKDFTEKKVGKGVPSVTALLYGTPGTGKSEFVHYLGHTLGKDITLKRVSDIESMYVGETEKNIAQAFREAQENGNILFFDEADSFFYPRKDAVRSFEKKFTNELLAQLDNFQGIVLFSTNDIEGLDHAAIRRFSFKVQFLPLKPSGILHFYGLLLKPMAGPEDMTIEEQAWLMAIRNLTPGDFKVVKEQHSFSAEHAPPHSDLIAALEREAEHKQERRMIRGFGVEKG
jgi:SpoVK/Ycf46/Vps4 family AAA+-type ATPase